MSEVILIIVILVLCGLAAKLYFDIQKKEKENKEILEKSKQIKELSELEAISLASEVAKKKIQEAESKAIEIEQKANQEVLETQKNINELEKQLNAKEKKLLERSNELDNKLENIDKKEKEIEDIKNEIKLEKDKLSEQIEKIAKLTKEEAEQLLRKEVEANLQDWITKKIKESSAKIQNQVKEVSKTILIEAMNNSATEFIAETTTTTITIEDEALKGKIIGKDGRNIRTFERFTGVDIIIDEAPNQVTLSSFDPIRREVAAMALNKLLKDGRVHPGTIEEMVTKVKKDMVKEIKKNGDELAFEAGFPDLPSDIIMLLGRFKYRFSYGQNLAKHTLETVKLAEQLSIMLGANTQTVKLAALLHDIGKVSPQEGKTHEESSYEIASKFYKEEKLLNAILAHHGNTESKFIESEILIIANQLSNSRPGALKDNYESYIKRIRTLEDIANDFDGVKSSFALQAGKEVRVIVEPDKVTDKSAEVIAYDIAKKIDDTNSYSSPVTVTVIREFRASTEAK